MRRRVAAGSRYACLYTCTPAPVTFAQNDTPSASFPVNAVVCNTALTAHIIAISSGATCSAPDSCLSNLHAYITWARLGSQARALAAHRAGAGGIEAAHAIHTAMRPRSMACSENGSGVQSTLACVTTRQAARRDSPSQLSSAEWSTRVRRCAPMRQSSLVCSCKVHHWRTCCVQIVD